MPVGEPFLIYNCIKAAVVTLCVVIVLFNNNTKFIAADTKSLTVRIIYLTQSCGDLAKIMIASNVAIGVIDIFEIINIENYNYPPTLKSRDVIFITQPVYKAGQSV